MLPACSLQPVVHAALCMADVWEASDSIQALKLHSKPRGLTALRRRSQSMDPHHAETLMLCGSRC